MEEKVSKMEDMCYNVITVELKCMKNKLSDIMDKNSKMALG